MHLHGKISPKPLPGLRLKTFSVLLFLLLASGKPFAQLAEDFSDGDFTMSPLWGGTTSNFVVNTALQLQLNTNIAGSSWLSTQVQMEHPDVIEWEFFLKQSFAPSGANFGRFYLASDQADLTAPLNGYYLQFGEAGSNDAIVLTKQSGTTTIPVCRASVAMIATSFEIRVKVIRGSDGLWQLYVDYSGGSDFVLDASGMDATYTEFSFAGWSCTYTITNGTRFYLDDIFIRTDFLEDTTPPRIVDIEISTAQSLEISFSEKLDSLSAVNVQNYFVAPVGGRPASASLDAGGKTVSVYFSEAFVNGQEMTLSIVDVGDLEGNPIPDTTINLLYFIPQPLTFRDVIITEIFPDPVPQVGLPAAEFVELFNRSPHPIQLEGWQFSDGTSIGIFPGYLLLPGNYVIICPSAALSQFSEYGPAVSLSNFPTLNNASDRLLLTDAEARPIDSVSYSSAWYKDEDKASGGWTLERIDPENVCETELNWSASLQTSGGTPGKQNSLYAVVPDNTSPVILEAHLISAKTLQLVFNEKLASAIPVASDFSIDPPMGITAVAFGNDARDRIDLELSQTIDTLTTYRITVQNVYDCPGNLITPGSDVVYLNRDLISPYIVSVEATSAKSITIVFSERLKRASAELFGNYNIGGIGSPVKARLQENDRSVALTFTDSFPNGLTQQITVSGVLDIAGNVMELAKKTFLYFEPKPVLWRDVMITEILSDPSPSNKLPEAEFVELLNRSGNPIDLTGWTFSDESTMGLLEGVMLQPGEYIILTTSAAAGAFSEFGQVVTVSPFPSLNNAGDILALRDRDGKTIDSVEYSASWYQDDERADGGWSLELIDPSNVCAAANNWTASESDFGGTPGSQNSAFSSIADNLGPRLMSVVPLDSITLLMAFDEKLENIQPALSQFTIVPALVIESVDFTDAAMNTLKIILAQAMEGSETYTASVANIFDCPGNKIQEAFAQAVFTLPEKAAPGDIVVNEILFNPRPTGVDFIELYNASEKTIDLKGWSMRNFNGTPGGNSVIVSLGNHLIYPAQYAVFTEDGNVLKGEYLLGVQETFNETKLPTLNDEEGSVTILSEEGVIIDSVFYSDKMHSAFIIDDEGISLERISSSSGGDHGPNWRSAGSTAGFATPGYLNSNVRADVLIDEGSVVIEPEVLQPQISAHEFAQIKYRFEEGGFIANVKIYDQQGRTVREIARNELLGAEGFFRWDGDADDGSPARTGYYMVWFEIFDAKGMTATFKKRVAIF